MESWDFLKQMVEVLDITIVDVLKEDFVKWKIKP